MEKEKFKARLGFDANDNTIINVANPKTKTDAVNLDHFDYYNGVIKYDSTRGYTKDHIVNYNNKLYYALKNIPKPAGNFNDKSWGAVVSSPNWLKIDSELTQNYQILSGAYISVSTTKNDVVLNLPTVPLEGETVHILDIGENTGYKRLQVKSKLNNIKFITEDYINNLYITIPKSQYVFIYIKGIWEVRADENIVTKEVLIDTKTSVYKAQSGDSITHTLDADDLIINLPVYANDGDVVKYSSVTPNTNFVTFKIDDADRVSTIDDKKRSFTFPTFRDIKLTYRAPLGKWVSTNTVKPLKHTTVTGLSYQAKINEEVSLINFTPDEGTIKITLPNKGIENDTIRINMDQLFSSKTVEVISVDSKMSYLDNKLGQKTATDTLIPNAKNTVSNKITFVPFDMRISSITFVKKGILWVLLKVDYSNVVADPKRPEIAGIIPLVDDKEIISNVMTTDNVAITPKQLQKRQSTEARMGIAKVASQAETLANTNDTNMVTPKKLHGTKASEKQQGLSFIASQAEVDTGANHTKFVTPKTLNNKLPNESGKLGVVSLVSSTNVTEGADRLTNGTGIYNKADGKLVVTPKTLSQLISSEKSIGTVYKATVNEVLTSVADIADIPLFVSPYTLSRRTATTSRTGIAKLTTSTSVVDENNATDIVTPLTLHSVKATESQQGLALLATQADVDGGTINNKIVTPKTLNSKLPNESGKLGVVSLVSTTVVAEGKDRLTNGTGIYNGSDGKLVVTPKSLRQLVSTEKSIGTVYKATEAEVLSGVADKLDTPLFVSPYTLSRRTATTARTGIAKLTTNATVLVTTNATDIVTPSTLHSVQSTDKLKGLSRFSTLAELNAKNNDSNPTPLILSQKFEKTTLTSKTKNVKITGNIWTGMTVTLNNDYDGTIIFNKNDNKLEDGYHFFIYKEGSAELTKALPWLDPPPSNATGYDIVKGKVVFKVTGTKEYKNDYLYECYVKDNTKFEKLMVGNKYYQRHTKVAGGVETNNGWDMLYSTLNKPTPHEINAIDRDDIIVGQVQVEDFLEIIVDKNNRLRIYPDKEGKKVGFAWREVV